MARRASRGTRLRKLTPREYRHLWDKIRETKLPARIYNRYKVVLKARHRVATAQIAREQGLNWKTVAHWIKAFNEKGFTSFEQPTNPKGRDAILRGNDLKRLLSMVTTRPKDIGLPFTQWSVSKLNAHGRKTRSWDEITDEGLRVTLHRHRVTLQRTGTWKESPDPEFVVKKNESSASNLGAPRMAVS